MADHSEWFAQALQFHDSGGRSPMVMYCQTREEVWEAGNALIQSQMQSINTIDNLKYRDPLYFEFDKTYVSDNRPMPMPTAVPGVNLGIIAPTEPFEGGEVEPQIPEEAAFQQWLDSRNRELGSSYVPENFTEGQTRKQTWLPKFLLPIIDSYRRRTPRVVSIEDFPRPDVPLKVLGYMDRSNPPQGINPNYIKQIVRDPNEGAYENNYKYALVFGIPIEFNPSGIWVIEDLYNDLEELES